MVTQTPRSQTSMDTRPRFGTPSSIATTSKPRTPTLTPRAASSMRLRSPSPPIPSRLPNSITTRSPKQRTPGSIKLEAPGPGVGGRVLRSPGQMMGSPSLPPPAERARTRTESGGRSTPLASGRSEVGRTGPPAMRRAGTQTVMGMTSGHETPAAGAGTGTGKFFYISDSKKPSTPTPTLIRKPSVPLFTSSSTPEIILGPLRPTAPRQTSTASNTSSASSKFFYANGAAEPVPAAEVADQRRSLTSSKSSSSIHQKSPPQTFTQLATPVPAPSAQPPTLSQPAISTSPSSDRSTTEKRLSTGSQKTSRPSSLISAPEPKSLSKSGLDPHQDARTTRKILDLEISNTSLLAVNSTLERQTRKQAAELRELRRRMARGSLVPSKIDSDDEYASASSHSEFDGSDSEGEVGDRRGGEEFATFVTQTQKLTSSLSDAVHSTERMLKEGYRALASQVRASEVGIGGRVLIGDESFVESEDGVEVPMSPEDGDGGKVGIGNGNGGEGRDSGMGGSQAELLRKLEEELEYFGYAV